MRKKSFIDNGYSTINGTYRYDSAVLVYGNITKPGDFVGVNIRW